MKAILIAVIAVTCGFGAGWLARIDELRKKEVAYQQEHKRYMQMEKSAAGLFNIVMKTTRRVEELETGFLSAGIPSPPSENFRCMDGGLYRREERNWKLTGQCPLGATPR